MEAEANKQDYDEIDMLLGEIPNETSDIPRGFELGTSDSALRLGSVSAKEALMTYPSTISCDTLNSNQSTHRMIPMVLAGDVSTRAQYDQADFSNMYYRTSRSCQYRDAINLSNEQSLASALKVLSLNDSVTIRKSAFPDHKPSSSPTAFSSDVLPLPHMKISTEELGPIEMSAPLPAMPNRVNLPTSVSDGSSPFVTNVEASIANGSVDFLDINDLKRPMQRYIQGYNGERWQTFPVYPGTMPANSGLDDTLEFLPEFSMQGYRLPLWAYKQQYYIDGQSPCIAYQQPYMPLCKMEDERPYSNPQNYFFSRQLQNIESDWNQGRKSRTPGQPLSGTEKYQFFETVEHHQSGKFHSHSHSQCSDTAINKPLDQLDPSMLNSCLGIYNSEGFCSKHDRTKLPKELMLASSHDVSSPKCLLGHSRDNFSRQIFPERILSRSGVTPLQSLRFGSVTVNHSTRHVEASENMAFDNNNCGDLRQCKGNHRLDAQNCMDSCLDAPDEKDSAKLLQKKYHSADDVVGTVCALARDQQGCRLLQEIFNEGTLEDIEKIFVEIIDVIVNLMIDPFANYLVQKLLDVCNAKQRMEIVNQITRPAGELVRISHNQHGTRAVQKLIEKVNSPEECALIVTSLKPAIVSLIKDRNGNHVAQRCLQHLSSEYTEVLFHSAVVNCIELARDPQGCVVLQKCLFHLEGNLKIQLMSNIVSEALNLSQDQFGNYIIQLMLEEVKNPCATSKILEQLEGHFAILAVQKYSSHVVQKCIKYGGERRGRVIYELTRNPHFLDIMLDRFGNYVIQTAFSESKGPVRAALVEAARPHVQVLRNHQFGKNVFCCMSSKK